MPIDLQWWLANLTFPFIAFSILHHTTAKVIQQVGPVKVEAANQVLHLLDLDISSL